MDHQLRASGVSLGGGGGSAAAGALLVFPAVERDPGFGDLPLGAAGDDAGERGALAAAAIAALVLFL